MSTRNRSLLIVAGVVATLAITCGLVARFNDRILLIDYYRSVDADTIRVGVTTDDQSFTRVSDVAETDSTVRVTIRSLSPPLLTKHAVRRNIELTVKLDRPLAGRTVVDGTGRVVSLRR